MKEKIGFKRGQNQEIQTLKRKLEEQRLIIMEAQHKINNLEEVDLSLFLASVKLKTCRKSTKDKKPKGVQKPHRSHGQQGVTNLNTKNS